MRGRSVVLGMVGACLTIGLGAPAAGADGGGVSQLSNLAGTVESPTGGGGYRADALFHATHKHTIVSPLQGGRSLSLPGIWGAQEVGYRGTTTGLSADGRTLVLHKRTPTDRFGAPKHTVLAVLSTGPLHLTRTIRLPSGFGVDALSPDGSRLFLIQYLSERDPTRYAVRAYDLQSGGLEPKPIVDPSEHEGEMRGIPITRTYSPDGRWAYTLYDGGEDGPFVHALDTGRGRARCIDLPPSQKTSGVYGADLEMSAGGGSFDVVDGHGATVAVVNTATLEASRPVNPPVRTTDAPSSSDGSSLGWWLVVAGASVLAAGTLTLLRRRRGAAPAA